jgi:hypothetical protein
VLHYAPRVPAYAGQNSMWDLGPPPAAARAVVSIGYPKADLDGWFRDVRRAATIDNGVSVDNDEQGRTVWVCSQPRAAWTTLWPEMKRLG